MIRKMANRFSTIAATISDQIKTALIKEESKHLNGVKLFVPTIADKIVLTQDWHFVLKREQRNKTLIDKWIKFASVEHKVDITSYGWIRSGHYENENEQYDACDPIYVSLPAGTILMIDRVYIRGKGRDYRRFDSYTFRILKGSPTKELVGARFWANLRYINQIVCDLYKPEE